VLERRHLWESSACHHQTSVTAGTGLHGTRTSLRLWFWAAYLLGTHTHGISALQLQRQVGIGRYETAIARQRIGQRVRRRTPALRPMR
jgi:hypothetical protein